MNGGLGTERSRETVRQLREAITSGRWPVNSKIPTEAELMVELGVGRSTVREAVRSLAHLGMLEPAPHRGTFVRSRSPVSFVLADFITEHKAAEVLGVRRALEVQACRTAALMRTEEQLERLRAAHEQDVRRSCTPLTERGSTPGQFHSLVVEMSGNQLMVDLYGGVMAGVRSFIQQGLIVSAADETARHDDHAAILDAIESGDAVRAAHVAAAHADRDLRAVDPESD
ncbi:MAG: FCD domain-containing protein [Aeromicrobium sp.]|uniref:FadR/GntR family transcriptional regulator n=1 Tax=Aeromicrobium sp. TaxID=1871063 RepID=UPI0039E58DAD